MIIVRVFNSFWCRENTVSNKVANVKEELENMTELNKVLEVERDSLTDKINKIEDEKRKSQKPEIKPSVETSSISSILVTIILTILAFVVGVLG